MQKRNSWKPMAVYRPSLEQGEMIAGIKKRQKWVICLKIAA
jgi:hypothetical protein